MEQDKVTYSIFDYGSEFFDDKEKIKLLAEEIACFTEMHDQVVLDFSWVDLYYPSRREEYTEHDLVLSLFTTPEILRYLINEIIDNLLDSRFLQKISFEFVNERVAEIITEIVSGEYGYKRVDLS